LTKASVEQELNQAKHSVRG